MEVFADQIQWPAPLVAELVEWLTADAAPSDELRDALDALHAAQTVYTAAFRLARVLPILARNEYRPPLELP